MSNKRDIKNGFAMAKDLYIGKFGVVPDVEKLLGAGSDRQYFRLSSDRGETVVATVGSDLRENRTFIGLARCFSAAGINVPKIIAESDDGAVYLQQDLGETALLSLLTSPERMTYAEKAMAALAEIQTVTEGKWGGVVSSSPFSIRQAMWDLNYFKYEFLKPCAFVFDEELLEDDFQRLSSCLAGVSSELTGFMYRDFQSRNILVKDGELWMIDFQGGRKGPLLYDAVSFLWQAKAGFTGEERRRLLSCYAAAIAGVRHVGKEDVLKDVGMFALFRTLQVLGAYGFRGLVERRAHFIESIPGALSNLRDLIAEGVLDCYPEIRHVCKEAVDSRFAERASDSRLTVKVFSFSYKRGYPEDLTGNGGGFMFDCRGLHNPGRYDLYKPLTGLDAPVRTFLESMSEVSSFIDAAMAMVCPSVEAYLRRGFSSLQVGFGCTGGRHRSVYCAESVARRIALLFPDARVVLCHREQGLEKEVRP